jgi:hypothetical protein
MNTSTPERTPTPRRRGLWIGLAVLLTTPIVIAAMTVALLASLAPVNAVLACVTDSYQIPRPVACWWVKGPAGIDPNQATSVDDDMTVFMFTLNGYGLESGLDPAEHDARVLDLLQAWSADVNWTATDSLGLTPLHAAVLHNQPVLVSALLAMGAPQDVVAADATSTFANRTPAEMVVAIHTLSSNRDEPVSADVLARRSEIANLLGTSLD